MENQETLKPIERKPKRKYRVNDRVAIIGGYYKLGSAGKVVALLDFDSVRVQFADGKVYRKHESWLKKLAPRQ